VNVAAQKGVVLYEQGRFDLAVVHLREALAVEPEDSDLHALLALALLYTEPLRKARFHAETAVRLGPGWWFPHYAFSVVWCESMDWEPTNEPNSPLGGTKATPSASAARATEAACEAVRLAPRNVACWGQLAFLRLSFERWGEALEASDNGLAIEPQDLQCLRFRALALTGLNRRKEAEETMTQLLSAHPNNPLAHLEVGFAQLRSNAPRHEARSSFLEALRLDPTLRLAHTGLERTEASVIQRREPPSDLPATYFDQSMAEERIPIGVRRFVLVLAAAPLVIFFIESHYNFNGPFLRFLEWLL